MPLELLFDRQEAGDCTSRVVFPDLAVSASLPAFEQTTVRLAPRAGTFGFAYGMNMIHGTLIIDPGGAPAAVGGDGAQAGTTVPASIPTVSAGGPTSGGPAATAGPTAGEAAQDAEAAERRAEIADLTRRLIVGVALTARCRC